MQGNRLAREIKQAKGKVSVEMLCPNDTVWVYAEKSDLIAWAKKYGDSETGMKLVQEENGAEYFLQAER